MKEFPELIKKARKQANLTQQELAQKIGIDHTYISKIERGVYLPNRNTVLAILDVLGITEAADRAGLLLTAGYASYEDLARVDGKQKIEQPVARGAFDVPFSLDEVFDDLRNPSFGEEVEKYLDEVGLSDKQRKLVERLALEQLRTLCRVIKEESEEKTS